MSDWLRNKSSKGNNLKLDISAKPYKEGRCLDFSIPVKCLQILRKRKQITNILDADHLKKWFAIILM